MYLSTLRAPHLVECIPKSTYSAMQTWHLTQNFWWAQDHILGPFLLNASNLLWCFYVAQKKKWLISLSYSGDMQDWSLTSSLMNRKHRIKRACVLKPLFHKVKSTMDAVKPRDISYSTDNNLILLWTMGSTVFGKGKWALLNSSAVKLWAWICILLRRGKALRKTSASLDCIAT